MKKFSAWLKDGGNDCLVGLANIFCVLFGFICLIFLIRSCFYVNSIIDLFLEKVAALNPPPIG